MRLLNNVRKAAFAFGLSALLAACGGGSGGYEVASTDAPIRTAGAAQGPEADYPQVLGEPFTVDGELYTPKDTLSYDTVGYATLDREGGNGISVAHKTLPMPSYVELTSLETGRTILARVERRGPMTSQRVVALSPGASAQLGIADGAPVRVRRVNAPEIERAELRAGRSVGERLATPDSLLAVLKKKLPTAGGSASLAGPTRPVGAIASTAVAPSRVNTPAATANVAAAQPAPANASFEQAFTAKTAKRAANRAYPLPPMPQSSMAQAARAPAPVAAPARPAQPVVVARAPEAQKFTLPGTRTAEAAPRPSAAPPRRAPAPVSGTPDGKFVIQAAAFSSKANAQRLAKKLDGGFVMQAGRYYRVRVGPYATRGQAEAALAKVRAAGYNDARVFSAG